MSTEIDLEIQRANENQKRCRKEAEQWVLRWSALMSARFNVEYYADGTPRIPPLPIPSIEQINQERPAPVD